MVMQQTEMLSKVEAERLSRRFADAFETFEAGEDAFAEDAFFDLNMPVWRFQLQGREAFAHQLRNITEGTARVDVIRTTPTATGFVQEHEEHEVREDGSEVFARRLWILQVRDGRIVEATGYCSGEWDEELKARHSREAPMLRGW